MCERRQKYSAISLDMIPLKGKVWVYPVCHYTQIGAVAPHCIHLNMAND